MNVKSELPYPFHVKDDEESNDPLDILNSYIDYKTYFEAEEAYLQDNPMPEIYQPMFNEYFNYAKLAYEFGSRITIHDLYLVNRGEFNGESLNYYYSAEERYNKLLENRDISVPNGKRFSVMAKELMILYIYYNSKNLEEQKSKKSIIDGFFSNTNS